MGSVTRFWILDASVGEVDRSRPPAEGAAATVLRLADEPDAALIGLSGSERARRVAAALDRWAAAHPEAQVVLLADADWVRTAAALALGLEHQDLRAPAATVDWPAGGAQRPALVGLDLDWGPPFSAKGRPKYPGGPGTAASGRT